MRPSNLYVQKRATDRRDETEGSYRACRVINKIVKGLVLHPPAHREPRGVIRNRLENLDIIGCDNKLSRRIEAGEGTSETAERPLDVLGRRNPIGLSKAERSRPNFGFDTSPRPVRAKDSLIEELGVIQENVSHEVTASNKRGLTFEFTSHAWRRGYKLQKISIEAKNRLSVERSQISFADNRQSPFSRE